MRSRYLRPHQVHIAWSECPILSGDSNLYSWFGFPPCMHPKEFLLVIERNKIRILQEPKPKCPITKEFSQKLALLLRLGKESSFSLLPWPMVD